MQGCEDQKDVEESDKILGDLRTFIEELDLSLPKIACRIGVFSATLTMWIAGSAKPSRSELLRIERFLKRRDRA